MARRKKPPKARPPGRFSLWVFQNRLAWFAVLFVAFVGVDQVTKVWAQASLSEARPVRVQHNEGGELTSETVLKHVPTRSITVLPKIFNLRYVENDAAAFSLTSNISEDVRRPFLVLFSLVALIGMSIWYFWMKRPDGLVFTAVALICAGDLGNLIDRVRLGYVIDFLDFHLGWIDRAKWYSTWPTFNIADACIVVGALLIVVRTFVPLTYEEDAPGELAEEAA